MILTTQANQKMWLETERLILREFQREDSQELAPIPANPTVMRFSPTGVISMAQTKKKIESFIACYREFGFGKWALIFKENNQLIGYCGIAIDRIDGKSEKELGYRLDPSFWSSGLATEAAWASIQQGLGRFKLPYVLGIVEPKNFASVRVFEKVGMRYDRKTIFHDVEMDVYRVDAAT